MNEILSIVKKLDAAHAINIIRRIFFKNYKHITYLNVPFHNIAGLLKNNRHVTSHKCRTN